MGLHVRDDGVVAVVVTSSMGSKSDPTLTLVLYSQSGQEKGKAKVPCLSNKNGAPHGMWGCTYYPGGVLKYSKKQNLYGVYWGTGCRQSQWCKGHQGGCQSYVDAATMQTKWQEGNAWICSHDMHQAYGVNPTTGAFAGACGGDAYPKGIKISVKATRGQFKRKTITKHWGNRGGKQAARFGQIVGDGCGFLLAWSSKGNASSGPHELMVTRLDASGGNLPGFPKKLSNDRVDKSDVTVVPFGSGYLVGYTVAGGSKFLKLDAKANKIGAPEAASTATLQKNGGGLARRGGGQIVWLTGITSQSFRIARLGGSKNPSPAPSPSPSAARRRRRRRRRRSKTS